MVIVFTVGLSFAISSIHAVELHNATIVLGQYGRLVTFLVFYPSTTNFALSSMFRLFYCVRF